MINYYFRVEAFQACFMAKNKLLVMSGGMSIHCGQNFESMATQHRSLREALGTDPGNWSTSAGGQIPHQGTLSGDQVLHTFCLGIWPSLPWAHTPVF